MRVRSGAVPIRDPESLDGMVTGQNTSSSARTHTRPRGQRGQPLLGVHHAHHLSTGTEALTELNATEL